MMEKFDDKQELQTLLKIKNNQKELLRVNINLNNINLRIANKKW